MIGRIQPFSEGWFAIIVGMRDYSAKIAKLKEELAEYEAQRKRIIATGQSWSLRNGEDRRDMTNVSLAQLNKMIETTEWKIEQLEGIADGSASGGIRVRAKVL